MKSKFLVWMAPLALTGALAMTAAAQSQDQSSSSSSTATTATETQAPAATPQAAVTPKPAASKATPVVRKRQVHQQARIKQGVNSGQLTPAETRRLEAQQGKIQADKLEAKSDGTVTAAERAKLHREQDRASRNIYRKKHNARTTTGTPPAAKP